jgi:hypothetical protein
VTKSSRQRHALPSDQKQSSWLLKD